MPEHIKAPGQSAARDDAHIAPWCADHKNVLVTVDTDFKGRWLRSGLLAVHQVEVIVFLRDPKGLIEQHRLVTRFIDNWQRELANEPYGYRVWEQPTNRALRLKKRRPR